MSDNHWLKALHAERLKRHGAGGAVAATTPAAASTSRPSSSTSTTPTLKSEGNKRKAEVIDLIDDDDKKESPQEKKKREQEEADEAFARRLAAEEDPQGLQRGNVARRASKEPVSNNGILDDGFDMLASIVLFQLISRHDASNALETLKAQCGVSRLTPRTIVNLEVQGLVRILGPKSQKKATAIVDLARKWSILPSCPVPGAHPKSAADDHFVTALTKSGTDGGVAGIGKWTLYTFLEKLGRTDILNADCYEVQEGVRWYTGADKRSVTAVREFAKTQNFRPQSMTRVSRIMRTLHRSVQVIRGGPRKRKQLSAQERIQVERAIAHTRNELEGL